MEEAPIQSGPHVWIGCELLESEWLIHFTPEELAELKIAADQIVSWSSGNDFLALSWINKLDNFKLPLLSEKVGEIFATQLIGGKGFFLWRGIPVDTWEYKTVCAAFLLIGRLFGNLKRQNGKGHVLGHVRNLGFSTMDPKVRNYQTSERNTFHVDWCDLVGLLCLADAKKGGESLLVSSAAVYNSLKQQGNGISSQLFHHFPMDFRGEVKEGGQQYFSMPVFTYYAGKLSAYYQRKYINSAQRFEEARKLTEEEREALDAFDETLNNPELQLRMTLKPGDIQFLHNHVVLHDRTQFEDWDEEGRKRHLLRVWVAPETGRPLPSYYAERFGSVECGVRGGVNISDVEPVAPLMPQ